MPQNEQNSDPAAPDGAPTPEPPRDKPKTWWGRYGGLTIGILAALGLALLVALNMNCPGTP